MHRTTFVGLLTLTFMMPAVAEPVTLPPPASLIEGAAELEFKADFTAEPSLAMVQDGTPANGGGNPFAQGQWIWTAYVGGAFGDEAGEVYLAHLGIGYHVLDNLSFNLEAVFAVADGDPGNITNGSATQDTLGGGFNLLLRWHFWQTDGISVYLDGGCGLLAFDKEFPGHGTNLNFTPQVGFGAMVDLNDSVMLMVGARWYHISNARHHGIENNPGFDGGLVYAGAAWPF